MSSATSILSFYSPHLFKGNNIIYEIIENILSG